MKIGFYTVFLLFFYFLYYVLLAVQKGEGDFSAFYKLMVISCAACIGTLLYHFA